MSTVPRTKWNGLKQALLLPKLEMEKQLMVIGLQYARETLRRKVEETEIWEELYSNHKMLKSSVSSRFTWADILDGVVDVLPPRDYSDDFKNAGQAELNRRFMEFRTKKARELLGTKAPKKPSYRDLYKAEHGRKETNQRSFETLIRRHKQEKEDLFKNQGMYTPLLPIISEETHGLRNDDVIDNDDVKLSARSLPSPSKQTLLQASTESHDTLLMKNNENITDNIVDTSGRKRKLGTVVSKHNGLTLSKAVSTDNGLHRDAKILARKNSKRGLEDFANFPKLPPISSSTETSHLEDEL